MHDRRGTCVMGTCMAGWHAWQGGLHGRGVCMSGGMHGRGCVAGGHAWQGGMYGKGVCMAGSCMTGGMCGGGCMAGETATAVDSMHSCCNTEYPDKVS